MGLKKKFYNHSYKRLHTMKFYTILLVIFMAMTQTACFKKKEKSVDTRLDFDTKPNPLKVLTLNIRLHHHQPNLQTKGLYTDI